MLAFYICLMLDAFLIALLSILSNLDTAWASPSYSGSVSFSLYNHKSLILIVA